MRTEEEGGEEEDLQRGRSRSCNQGEQEGVKVANKEEGGSGGESTTGTCTAAEKVHCLNKWRPILLFIPLRLGLTEINADYVDAIKVVNRPTTTRVHHVDRVD